MKIIMKIMNMTVCRLLILIFSAYSHFIIRIGILNDLKLIFLIDVVLIVRKMFFSI